MRLLLIRLTIQMSTWLHTAPLIVFNAVDETPAKPTCLDNSQFSKWKRMTPSKCRPRNTPRPCTISCKCHFFFAPPALSPAFAALAIEYSISAYCCLVVNYPKKETKTVTHQLPASAS